MGVFISRRQSSLDITVADRYGTVGAAVPGPLTMHQAGRFSATPHRDKGIQFRPSDLARCESAKHFHTVGAGTRRKQKRMALLFFHISGAN